MEALQNLADYLGVKISELESLQQGYIPCKCKKWFTLTMKEHGRECSNMVLTPNTDKMWYSKRADGKFDLFMQFSDAKYPIGHITEQELEFNF